MGTSKSYTSSLQGQPQWGELSGTVTSNCNGGTVSRENLGRILGNYVRVIGGAGTAGRGNSRIAGRAGIKTAERLGRFFSSFSDSGRSIADKFAELGIVDLTTKTVADIINNIIEYCTGPSSTIDDRAAKEASRKLLEEVAEKCGYSRGTRG